MRHHLSVYYQHSKQSVVAVVVVVVVVVVVIIVVDFAVAGRWSTMDGRLIAVA